MNTEKLVSLGSIAYQPLLVFYRSATNINVLSGLEGRRLAIGAEGSGTRTLTLLLLQTNGIVPGGNTQLLALDAEAAANALTNGTVDAVFLMGDSASTQVMRTLTHSEDIRLFDFAQADAYTRRFSFLNKIRLPEGSVDFGRNIPAQDVMLVGPTVELVARKGLNPVVANLLLDAAREVHGTPGLLQNWASSPHRSCSSSSSARTPPHALQVSALFFVSVPALLDRQPPQPRPRGLCADAAGAHPRAEVIARRVPLAETTSNLPLVPRPAETRARGRRRSDPGQRGRN